MMRAEYIEKSLEIAAVGQGEVTRRRKVIVDCEGLEGSCRGEGGGGWHWRRAAEERAVAVGTGGELQGRDGSTLVCSRVHSCMAYTPPLHIRREYTGVLRVHRG